MLPSGGWVLLRGIVGVLLVCTAVCAEDTVAVATVDASGATSAEARQALVADLSKRADVVVLHGVYDSDDLRALTSLFEAEKFEHAKRYDRSWGGSGLLITSRFPLQDDGFTGFEWAGKPHKPWHGDYYKSKGVALVTVDSPLGAFWLGATAWHAKHQDEEYRWLRIHQALETASAVGNHGVIPPESSRDTGRMPLLVAGGLDCEPGSLPLRVLSQAAGAKPVRDDMGPNWILSRPGGVWGLRAKQAQALSTAEAPGWVVEFRKQAYPNGPPLASSMDFRLTADQLLPLVREEADVVRKEGNRATLGGLGLFLVGGALYAIGWILGRPPKRKPRKRKRRPSSEGEVEDGDTAKPSPADRKQRRTRRKRGCCLFGCLSLIVAHVALWLIYQGRVFVPYELGGLESCITRLEPPELIILDGPR